MTKSLMKKKKVNMTSKLWQIEIQLIAVRKQNVS